MIFVVVISFAASLVVFRSSHDLMLTKFASSFARNQLSKSSPTNGTIDPTILNASEVSNEWDWEPEDAYENYAAHVKIKISAPGAVDALKQS